MGGPPGVSVASVNAHFDYSRRCRPRTTAAAARPTCSRRRPSPATPPPTRVLLMFDGMPRGVNINAVEVAASGFRLRARPTGPRRSPTPGHCGWPIPGLATATPATSRIRPLDGRFCPLCRPAGHHRPSPHGQTAVRGPRRGPEPVRPEVRHGVRPSTGCRCTRSPVVQGRRAVRRKHP